MNDLGTAQTISLIIAALACVIGICTFVTGMVTRAKQDGVFMQKIEFCVAGISEIKEALKESGRTVNEVKKDFAALDKRVSNVEVKLGMPNG